MLSRTLVPLPCPNEVDIAYAGEPFSYAHLASYNHTALPARVGTSFQRAWSASWIKVFPRVSNTQLAFTMAGYEDAGRKKVVVGIEGLTSVRQIVGLFMGDTATMPFDLEGFVLSAYIQHAGTIRTLLLADADFVRMMVAERAMMIFSGYSLGAAVAEIVARKILKDKPDVNTLIYKFGSPHVGSSVWVNSPQRVPGKLDVYCERDRIDVMPYGTFDLPELRLHLPGAFCTFFASNLDIDRRDMRGEPMEGSFPDTYAASIALGVLANVPLTPSNAWYWHAYRQYRCMLSAVMARVGQGFENRLPSLEFADDNNFANNWQLGRESNEVPMEVLDPGPADIIVPPDPAADDARLRAHRRDELQQPNANQGVQLETPRVFSNPAWQPRSATRARGQR